MAKTSPPAQKKSPNSDKMKRKDAALQQSLESELGNLRAIVQDISRRFLTKVESRIVHAAEASAEIPGSVRKRAALQNAVRMIRNADVKHNKGRLRDLKAIQQMVQEINRSLEELR